MSQPVPPPPTDPQPRERRLSAPARASLERRLPLWISALLLLVMAVYTAASYRAVRTSAVLAATEHLRGLTRQLADLTRTASAARVQVLRGIAADTVIVAALRERPAEPASEHLTVGALPTPAAGAAAERLRRGIPATDSTLAALELRAADGTPRAAIGAADTPLDEAMFREALRTTWGGDSAGRSPLYAQNDHVFSWAVVPVRARGELLGFVAERRRVGNSVRVEEQIRHLAGQDVSVLLTDPAGRTWTTLRGRPIPAPLHVDGTDETFQTTTTSGERVIGARALVPGTSFVMVLTFDERRVLGRADAVLRWMVGVGLLLLIAGALAAWLLSRRVTHPLRVVSEAAEAVAAGEYHHRVDVARDDELGRLGSTFNAMASRIGESHTELARRVDESTTLAEALEARNEALRSAQAETLRAVRRLERLQSVTGALAAAVDFEGVASVVVRQGLEAAEATAGGIFVLTPERDALDLVRVEGFPSDLVAPYVHVPIDARMPVAEVARTGEPVFIESARDWRTRYDALAMHGLGDDRARAALPLVGREGLIGVIALSYAPARAFTPEMRTFLLALAQQCAQALDRARLFDAAVDARNAADEARLAAQAASAAKSAFLAMMSHELRTPLNAIGGYAELLELGIRGPVSPAQVEDLMRIRRNQQHLLSIINDILNHARIEAGQLDVRLRDVPVREVLAGIDALIAPQLAAKRLKYSAGACASGLAVRADRERLEQILLNLVSNAIRFTDEGGSVAVSCEAHGDKVRIRVSDTGVGIPTEKLEAVFEPFVQVDAGLTRRTGGTGLGLAISRDLATAMGGRVSAESTLGVGSVFILELPRAADVPGAPPPDAPRAVEQGA